MIAWATEVDLSEYEKFRLKCSRAFQLALTDVDDAGKIEMIISIPVRNCYTNEYMGRENVDYYPRDFCLNGEDSFGPHNALDYAHMYYEEAKSYTDPKMKQVRAECLKAAELLCLHTVTEKNWSRCGEAWRLLGNVYLLSGEEKTLWPQSTCEVKEGFPEIMKIASADERAALSFKNAVTQGDFEALYKLSDLKIEGRGCKTDYAQAFKLLNRAWRKRNDVDQVTIGNVALRLGQVYEKAIGTEQNLDLAQSFYEKAIISFEIAIREDIDAFDLLSSAERGLRRVTQEKGLLSA